MIRNECFTVSFCPKNRIEIQPLRGKNAEYYLAVLCTLRIVLDINISTNISQLCCVPALLSNENKLMSHFSFKTRDQ
jgi:hypothetical protein